MKFSINKYFSFIGKRENYLMISHDKNQPYKHHQYRLELSVGIPNTDESLRNNIEFSCSEEMIDYLSSKFPDELKYKLATKWVKDLL